jgi:hypothetical protein
VIRSPLDHDKLSQTFTQPTTPSEPHQREVALEAIGPETARFGQTVSISSSPRKTRVRS